LSAEDGARLLAPASSLTQQTARVRQPDAVDEIQPHLAPFDHNQPDRPVDPATDRGQW
jgi:hypothetical protein